MVKQYMDMKQQPGFNIVSLQWPGTSGLSNIYDNEQQVSDSQYSSISPAFTYMLAHTVK